MVKGPYKHPSEKPRNSYLIKNKNKTKTVNFRKQTQNSLQVLPVASQTRPVLQFPLFAPEQSPPMSSSVGKPKTHVQQAFSSTLADLFRHAHPSLCVSLSLSLSLSALFSLSRYKTWKTLFDSWSLYPIIEVKFGSQIQKRIHTWRCVSLTDMEMKKVQNARMGKLWYTFTVRTEVWQLALDLEWHVLRNWSSDPMVNTPYKHPSEKTRNYFIKTTAHCKKQTNTNTHYKYCR